MLTNPIMPCGGFHHVFKRLSFQKATTQLIQDMFDLTATLEAHQFEITPSQIQEAAIKRSQVRDRLLALSKHLVSHPPTDDPIVQSAFLASIIYLRALIYLVPFRDPVNHRIVHLLKISLAQSMPMGLWHQLPGLLLWCLLVGGACVLDREDFHSSQDT
jgi:hypothetical protein